MGKGIRMHGFICLLLLVWTWGLLGDRSALAQANLDETMLRNVDAQVSTAFFGLRFNRQTGTYVGFVTATNHSATPVSTPLYLVVTAVTPGSVRILNAQGTTVQQHAYYDLSRVIAGGVLVPQATTARLTLEFRNPTNAAIQIKASVFVPAQERTLQALTLTPSATRLTTTGARQALQVLGHFSDGSMQDVTAASTGTTYASSQGFVASVDTEGVVQAVANGTTTITATYQALQATAQITVELGVSLTALALTPPRSVLRVLGATQALTLTGTFSDSSTRDLTAAASGVTYSVSPSGLIRVSPNGVVTAVQPGTSTVTALYEQQTATAAVQVILSGGQGFVRGEVYDDTLGLPLAAATVTLLADGGGPLASPIAVVTDTRGQYVLPGQAGDALVRITKAGFTSVERQGGIPANAAMTMLDARLTPLDTQANGITSALGGQAQHRSGVLSLHFVPGSLATDHDIRVTALSNQGLQGPLPPGWSPLAIVDVQPADLLLGQSAVVQAPNPVRLAPQSTVTLARYDTQTQRWLVQDPARRSRRMVHSWWARSWPPDRWLSCCQTTPPSPHLRQSWGRRYRV